MAAESLPGPMSAAPDSPPSSPAQGPALSVQNLEAGFGAVPIFQALSFDVEAGHTLVVLGESGCGKTTLLKSIAGLIPIERGEIRLDSRVISQLTTSERRVIYLDQEPLLFEHLTVIENIGFAMRLRKVPPREIEMATAELLQAIDLADHGHKREWQLSGGQKQRVAFARAVLARPELLLLDEPFCSLDSKTRGQMQTLYATLSRRFSLTSIFVTHDVKEALTVGDRFARMSGGELLLYSDRPAFINDRATGIAEEIDFWRKSGELLE